ncbi:hypothetical protein STCU_11829 [Strigomonas culicis]|uniref:Uncharacterized protein n=1 Tax=Strigomonas culicis TaxID=28005 RepID=S9UYU5_9TRYP|nr:hypothetical protein STCU_11829 [Strigomonas culicis]|eukprot:EPY15695.1 hypothetical protein STCU_11829 [Strigomonas culicis]
MEAPPPYHTLAACHPDPILTSTAKKSKAKKKNKKKPSPQQENKAKESSSEDPHRSSSVSAQAPPTSSYEPYTPTGAASPTPPPPTTTSPTTPKKKKKQQQQNSPNGYAPAPPPWLRRPLPLALPARSVGHSLSMELLRFLRYTALRPAETQRRDGLLRVIREAVDAVFNRGAASGSIPDVRARVVVHGSYMLGLALPLQR